ncbi:hypothetical protein L6164_004114 [Bauhinia variegata]|uniref:Uncharacterized protein n=1 Tax=Bauhinia variegata TaxID=167791 RepID=A0ACB9Q3E8_BAUVA|nr:hypothetical protein L6164_004114 [Bauhinia variegata]
MELMQEAVKGYSDREEEEEEELDQIRRLHQQDAAATNINFNHRKLEDFMELSLANNKDIDDANFHGGASSSGGTNNNDNNNNNNDNIPIEKEHMFDKVVTPSDVGKLNRLVIPKQHAEKYFPLDSSTNEKGLLLNFEDRNGKLWRFRYSYWNSSQSYVMTKGWSRFVKEKKLYAGDIVSFQRGVGELYRHRLYIDWRHRPNHGPDHAATLITPFFLHNQQHLPQYSIRWGGRFYSLPAQAPGSIPWHQHEYLQLQQLNYNNMYPFHQQNHRPQQYHGGGGSHSYNELNSGSGSMYYNYLRSTTPAPSVADYQGQQVVGGNAPMIIDSVPVSHHHHHQHQHGKSTSSTATTGKRLRLFGVNMECASPAEDPKCCLLSSSSVAHVAMTNSLPSSSIPPLHLRVAQEDHSLGSSSARFDQLERGQSSMLFDLDPSLQYRQ